MITSFERIKNLGVFNDYAKPQNCEPFKKYNLIYGLNGSGKTTLSRFFRDLKTGKAEGFPELKYKINLSEGISIKEGEKCPINIHVFNSDYVEANVGSCEDEISPIYILGTESNELNEIIKSDQKKLKALKDAHDAAELQITALKKSRGRIFTDIAKEIAVTRTAAEAKNYNKRSAETLYMSGQKMTPLATTEYETVKKSLDQPPLNIIHEVTSPNLPMRSKQGMSVDIPEFLAEVGAVIRETCQTSAISTAIQRLADDPSLSKWVETGFEIHKDGNFTTCEFCQQTFPDMRKQNLEKHFSESDTLLKQRISDIRDDIIAVTNFLTEHLNYRPADFYNNLQSESEIKRTDLSKAREQVAEHLNILKEVVDDKDTRRGESYEPPLPTIDAEQLEKTTSAYNSIIALNNNETSKFNERLNKIREQIESHLLSTIVKKVSGIDRDLTAENSRKELCNAGNGEILGITKLENRIDANKAKISDSHRGADLLSSKLKSFLGRDELKFEQEEDGYRITRYGRPAQRLSEGEKTAVAFIYYTTTLSERDFNLEESILVIDDPISSFDSNSVYQAFGFLKTATQDAKQVFYLTHNFDFLKLMLNWVKNHANKDKSLWMLHCFTDQAGKRNTTLNRLDKTLQHCSSEVSYLFKVLYKFHEKGGDGTIESTYHLPNVIRKVLEIFLNHHMPRAGMHKQLDQLPFDKQKKTALNKYANDLSHPTMSNIDPALIAETKTNIGHLFEMMQAIAPDYFNTLKHEALTN